MSIPARTVQRVHFDDFDGKQFERLVYAYHTRTDAWRSLEWYGQVGSDLGRDIWGIRNSDSSNGESVCIQCANRKIVSAKKVFQDIDKVLTSSNGKPEVFRLVCTSTVSAEFRDKIKQYAQSKGIHNCDIWSGEEFEEKLRHNCESLLRRFLEGEIFPDDPQELKCLSEQMPPTSDAEILNLLARAFDRPAFHAPFQHESSLPAFKQAITDTIQVLNTGIWQTRDGKEIARLPSRHMLTDAKTRETLAQISQALENLRHRFDEAIRKGEIQHCDCKDPNCPVFFFSPSSGIAEEMDKIRSELLIKFSRVQQESTQGYPTQSSQIQTAIGNGNTIIGRDFIKTERVTNRNVVAPGPDHISEEQAFEIRKRIDDLAKDDTDAGRPDSHRDWYSSLYRRFKITSYKTLARDDFEEAVSWLQQKRAINRSRLRRPANDKWRAQLYAGIYARWTKELGFPKEQIYSFAQDHLELKKPIDSLKDLGEQNLEKLNRILIRLCKDGNSS